MSSPGNQINSGDNRRNSLILIHSKMAYLKFAISNFLLIGLFQLFIAASGGGFDGHLLLIMMCSSTALILIQYPLLNAVSGWKLKLVIFYLSMIAYLVLSGLAISWGRPVGINPAGSPAAALDGIVRMILFGHLLGLPIFPIVVLFNVLLRRTFFFQIAQKPDN